MLYTDTPIGKIEVPKWEENARTELSDEELLCLAIEENKKICVSPATFAMIEKRNLGAELQSRINPSIAHGAYSRNRSF